MTSDELSVKMLMVKLIRPFKIKKLNKHKSANLLKSGDAKSRWLCDVIICSIDCNMFFVLQFFICFF